MRGRFVVIAMLLVGAALAAVAALLRGRGEPRLPLEPGTILLITAERGAIDLGPLADGALAFPHVHGVSRDPAAAVGAIVTGRMPRENGRVRAGDAIAREVPQLRDLLAEAGFVAQEFTAPDRAAAWLLDRGSKPAFAQLHVAGGDPAGTAALAAMATQLVAGGLRERLVVVAVGLADPAAPSLLLRVPSRLLPERITERDVSLLDVAPSLLELYGIVVPPPLMEPFLLGPRSSAPRFFLFTEPLAAPPPEFEGCDAVTLLAGGRRYTLDPRVTPAERCDEPRAIDEMRRVLESAWGYRIEKGEGTGGRARARFVPLSSSASSPAR